MAGFRGSGAHVGGLGDPGFYSFVYGLARWECCVLDVKAGPLSWGTIFLLPLWQGRNVEPLQAPSIETFVRAVVGVAELLSFLVLFGK